MRIDKIPGLNNQDDVVEIGLGGLVTAQNIDLTRTGKAKRRGGYRPVYTGNVDAAWSDGRTTLFIDGGALKRLNEDYTVDTIRAGIEITDRLQATRAYDDRIYWTTGRDYGVVRNGVSASFGIEKPLPPNITKSDGGSMPAGRYLAAISYVRSDGVEGPLSTITAFTGEHGFSATWSVPTEDDIVALRLYLTAPDSETLLLAADAPIDSSTIYYHADTSELRVEAETEFLGRFPPIDWIAELSGSLYGADKQFVYFSEPFSELIDLRQNYIQSPSEITGIGQVEDGLYLGTANRVYFIAGTDPADAAFRRPVAAGMIAGSLVPDVDGSRIGEGRDVGRACLWASEDGFYAGLQGGRIIPLTERRVAGLQRGNDAAALFRSVDGENQYIFTGVPYE